MKKENNDFAFVATMTPWARRPDPGSSRLAWEHSDRPSRSLTTATRGEGPTESAIASSLFLFPHSLSIYLSIYLSVCLFKLWPRLRATADRLHKESRSVPFRATRQKSTLVFRLFVFLFSLFCFIVSMYTLPSDRTAAEENKHSIWTHLPRRHPKKKTPTHVIQMIEGNVSKWQFTFDSFLFFSFLSLLLC